jgi:hypothetical protein
LPGSDSDRHCNSCVYADGDGNSHAADADGDGNCDCDCERGAEVYADAQAATHAASTPISSSV